MKTSAYRYLLFVGLNLGMVVGCLLIGTPGKAGIADAIRLQMYAIAAAIIVFQYPILTRAKNWWIRIGVFYAGMVVFLVIWGLLNSWGGRVGSNQAGALALLDGALRMVIFGHFFGIWFLPIIIFINWMLRRQLFPQVVSIGS